MIDALINNLTADINLIQRKIDSNKRIGFGNMARLLEAMTPAIFEALGIANLINMNQIKVNFPAIDAADSTRRIAVQVTSNASATKINETIKTFTKKDPSGKSLQDQYDTLYIFGFCEKKAPKTTPKYCKVIDADDVIGLLIDLNDENSIQKVIDAVRVHVDYSSIHPYDDVDCLKIMLSHIDRGAIRHRMIQEGSISDMFSGLQQIAELIGTGSIKSKKKSKALHEFRDPAIERFLRETLGKINEIRGAAHVSNGMGYLDLEAQQKIDDIKQSIAFASRDIAALYGIPITIEMC